MEENPMKKTFFISLIAFLSSILPSTSFGNLTGAGATFPYPIYTKWADTYQKTSGVKINYKPIRSGGGITPTQAKLVDFGASDKPLSGEELKASNLAQFPTVIGGIVPIFNLPYLKDKPIQLSGEVLADIYSGKIKKW